MEREMISIEATIQAPVEKAWRYWTLPKHICKWNYASPEWHTPAAENDLRKAGKFSYRMEAVDGSAGFDFKGIYDEVDTWKTIAYTMDDGRKVVVTFMQDGDTTFIRESFEPENSHSLEMQKEGWQAILNNFKSYVERSPEEQSAGFIDNPE